MMERRTKIWILWVSLLLLLLFLCLVGAIATLFFFPFQSQGQMTVPTPFVRAERVPQPVVATIMPEPLPVRSGVNELEAQIDGVYRQAGAGVVNITSRSFEYDFFLRPVPREGSGSGFFYDDQGHIVTNYHVVENAEELQVTLADGRSMPAQITGIDPSDDLAVIQVDIESADVPVISIGDSTNLQVGQFVVAIGNPFGLKGTLTFGVISSLGRVIESPNQRFIGEIIQTDTAVNPGNSGGPLLNLAGEVVGVNSAILSPSGASAGIGFAIPARTVQRVVPELIATGRFPHPSLGVQFHELNPETARLLQQAGMDVPVDSGLLVVKTLNSGLFGDKGLQSGSRQVRVGNMIVPVGGDILIAIQGEPVRTVQDVIVHLETQTKVGDTIEVTVIRDGKEQNISVTLQELAT